MDLWKHRCKHCGNASFCLEGWRFGRLSTAAHTVTRFNELASDQEKQNQSIFSNVISPQMQYFCMNCSNTMIIWSAMWNLMGPYFSTRASIATVPNTHIWIPSYLWIPLVIEADVFLTCAPGRLPPTDWFFNDNHFSGLGASIPLPIVMTRFGSANQPLF